MNSNRINQLTRNIGPNRDLTPQQIDILKSLTTKQLNKLTILANGPNWEMNHKINNNIFNIVSKNNTLMNV